jgi:competence protein ComEC
MLKIIGPFLCASIVFASQRIHYEEPTHLESSNHFSFIVWNVGQGLWTTLVKDSRCYHFDMGGERAPWPAILRLCRDKENILSFSHWDWDHIRFAQDAGLKFPRICILNPPAGEPPEKRKGFFDQIKRCARANIEQGDTGSGSRSFIRELRSDPPPDRFQKHAKKTANEVSRVFVIEQTIVAPGDSPQKAEKYWAPQLALHQTNQIQDQNRIRILVLGHHGSRTSTSMALLSRLPHLTSAIVSARKKKYGHPHAEVVARLRDKKIPMLLTEEWGSLHFQMKKEPPVTAAHH